MYSAWVQFFPLNSFYPRLIESWVWNLNMQRAVTARQYQVTDTHFTDHCQLRVGKEIHHQEAYYSCLSLLQGAYSCFTEQQHVSWNKAEAGAGRVARTPTAFFLELSWHKRRLPERGCWRRAKRRDGFSLNVSYCHHFQPKQLQTLPKLLECWSGRSIGEIPLL